MPKLREALKQTSGTDVGGNDFTLTETDVQPYIDDPEMAQMEADVTQARYGGSSIQDSPELSRDQMLGRDPKFRDSALNAGRPPADLSRRGDFENSVFKQLQSENMPDGNPFKFNPTATMNAHSKQDLPELFEREFQGQVAWEDRHLLDDDQKKYWMQSVKGYRAHLKSAFVAEREEAVNSYNQMMNQFDNAAKEQQFARKQTRQRRQDITKASDKKRKRQDERQKTNQANLAKRTELLTGIQENITKVMEASTTGALSDEEISAITTVIKSQKDELRAVNAEINSRKVPKPKSGVSKVEASGKATEPAGEKDADGKTIVRKKMPKAGERTVAKTGKVKSGPNKGKIKIIYTDGSTAYADETK